MDKYRRSSLISFLVFAIFTISFWFAPNTANAAAILKVSGQKAIIGLEGMSVNRGDLLYATQGGKKRAILQVVKVAKSKALVRIRKGKALKGMRIIPRSNLARQQKQRQEPQEEEESADMSNSDDYESAASGPKESSFALGALFGYGINSMTVALKTSDSGDTEDVVMTGNGVSTKIAADYNFTPSVGVRITSGLEMFNVYGEGKEEVCDDQSDTKCSTEISFFTIDAYLRWIFLPGTFAPWLGGGFSFLIPTTS
ncbi:MAG: hypothetical protein KDD25_08850, partial [Bdellovibrionales bacterium]|nr:hypothetical protein [Bdellovibrionales bacterium]